MPDSQNITFWGEVLGYAALIFGGGAWLGKHESKLKHHDEVIKECHIEKIMTEEKCEKFYDRGQEATKVQLDNIKEKLSEMNVNQKELASAFQDFQLQFSSVLGQLTTAAVRRGDDV